MSQRVKTTLFLFLITSLIIATPAFAVTEKSRILKELQQIKELAKEEGMSSREILAERYMKWRLFKRLNPINLIRLKRPYGKFKKWLMKKDSEYYDNSKKSTKIRHQWEEWLGVDVFHLYYKYKEAEKIVKKKTSFHTPDFMGKMKVNPEYKDGKIWLIVSKKF